MSRLQTLAIALAIGAFAPAAIADITNITQGTTHPTIQDAIDNAVDFDEIVVDPGEYIELYIDLQGKPITVRSQDPTDPAIVVSTVVNGANSGPVFICHQGEGRDTLISGFVITNGGHESDNMGAMFIASSSPTITHCTFQGNSRYGGPEFHQSTALIEHCAFIDNSSMYARRGGMYLSDSDATVSNCLFANNSMGGGMMLDGSSPTVTDCTFNGNSAASGGGVLVENSSDPTFQGCVFQGNHADDDGGGVALKSNCNPTMSNCTFRNNEATTGGGLFLLASCSAVLTDCVLADNIATFPGGGIYIDGDGTCTCSLQDTTICANLPDQLDGPYTDDGGNLISQYAPPPAEPTPACPEDLNGDGVVGQADLGMLLAMYGQSCP